MTIGNTPIQPEPETPTAPAAETWPIPDMATRIQAAQQRVADAHKAIGESRRRLDLVRSHTRDIEFNGGDPAAAIREAERDIVCAESQWRVAKGQLAGFLGAEFSRFAVVRNAAWVRVFPQLEGKRERLRHAARELLAALDGLGDLPAVTAEVESLDSKIRAWNKAIKACDAGSHYLVDAHGQSIARNVDQYLRQDAAIRFFGDVRDQVRAKQKNDANFAAEFAKSALRDGQGFFTLQDAERAARDKHEREDSLAKIAEAGKK